MEKHELGKIDFELIDDAFKALLQTHPDPMTTDKVADLRNKFRDAFTGWRRLKRQRNRGADRGKYREVAGA